MKHISLVIAAILIAGNAFGSGEIIREKAKQQRDLNNQRQGVTSPAPATPAAPGATTPAPPQGMSSAQQALLDHVDADLTALKVGTPATADQKEHLQNDLGQLGKGTTKPSKQSLTKLSADLATALNEKTLPAADLKQVIKDINIIANCSILTAAKSQAFAAEVQTIFKKAGIGDSSVQAVGADLKAIVNEIQKSKPALYQ